MTDEQADELLKNNDWAKWSDARELLMEAAHMGAMDERKTLDAELRRLSAENERVFKLADDQDSVIRRQRTERQTLEAQRDALLEFARYVEAIDPGNPAPLFEKARAAIKAVEGEKT